LIINILTTYISYFTDGIKSMRSLALYLIKTWFLKATVFHLNDFYLLICLAPFHEIKQQAIYGNLEGYRLLITG
jgi:hypothetical protein